MYNTSIVIVSNNALLYIQSERKSKLYRMGIHFRENLYGPRSLSQSQQVSMLIIIVINNY